jgi:CheY-like chemotaxis protein
LSSDPLSPDQTAGDDAATLPDDWSFLIVDDNPAALATLRTLMLMLGLEAPLEAMGGQEAMDVVRHNALDCIITDLRMEPMSGVDFIRWVRNSNQGPNPSVRILAISAYRDPAEVSAIAMEGANGFLGKPLSIPTLRTALQQLRNRPGHFVDIAATPDPMPKAGGCDS